MFTVLGTLGKIQTILSTSVYLLCNPANFFSYIKYHVFYVWISSACSNIFPSVSKADIIVNGPDLNDGVPLRSCINPSWRSIYSRQRQHLVSILCEWRTHLNRTNSVRITHVTHQKKKKRGQCPWTSCSNSAYEHEIQTHKTLQIIPHGQKKQTRKRCTEKNQGLLLMAETAAGANKHMWWI